MTKKTLDKGSGLGVFIWILAIILLFPAVEIVMAFMAFGLFAKLAGDWGSSG